MNKSIILKQAFLILFLSCLSFVSKIYSQATSNQTSFALAIHGQVLSGSQVNTIDGFLNNLFIESAAFVKIKKRIVFRFYSINPTSLTLYGWESDDDLFNDVEDIQLEIGAKTTVPFGSGTYFGNLVLRRDDVRSIKRQLKISNTQYVVFVPRDPKLESGQISYVIELTNDDPSKKTFATVPTGLSLNPSPPRNSN